jgi:hypothetical protein
MSVFFDSHLGFTTIAAYYLSLTEVARTYVDRVFACCFLGSRHKKHIDTVHKITPADLLRCGGIRLFSLDFFVVASLGCRQIIDHTNWWFAQRYSLPKAAF